MPKITAEVELNFESVVVDAETRTIRNVVLCGNESKNGYKYPPSCFKNVEHVVNLYTDVPVCIDHSTSPGSRKVRDIAGFIRNVRFESGKPVGDIELETAIECGVDLLALAKKARKGIGMSHVAQCKMSKDKKSVELVEQVLTVDVVVNPATTKTFFEQEQEQEMELEQLKAELDTLKAEKAVLKSELDKATTMAETAKTEVTNLLTEVTNLRGEVSSIKPQLEKYQATEKAAVDKAAVEKLLLEAGFDLADKILVSEQFMTILLAASADGRGALIADRKAATAHNPASKKEVHSLERQTRQEQKTVPGEYIKNFFGKQG